ncbi:MAG: CRISPR-associated endonuclease Cas1, partial [Anaerolineae bacterium]
MAPVYVREQGAVVRRRGERLVVTRHKKELLDSPLIHLDQLVLFGNVQLTTPAVAMLLQAEVDVVFLSLYGKFRGRLMHTGSKFARLRHAQLHKMSHEQTNLAIARQVVAGKLHNQRSLLQGSGTSAVARGCPASQAWPCGVRTKAAEGPPVRVLPCSERTPSQVSGPVRRAV